MRRWPRLVATRQPDPIAGGDVECAALSKCWRELSPLHANAQLRVIEHLRQIVDERARYEMKDITNE